MAVFPSVFYFSFIVYKNASKNTFIYFSVIRVWYCFRK